MVDWIQEFERHATNTRDAVTGDFMDASAQLDPTASSEEEMADQRKQWWDSTSTAINSQVEGTALDNQVTDTASKWFVQDPVRSLYRTTSGIDPKTGEANQKVRAEDAVESAFVGAGAVSKVDDVASLGGKAIGNSDMAIGSLGKLGSRFLGQTDEAARLTDEGADAYRAGDDVTTGSNDFTSTFDTSAGFSGQMDDIDQFSSSIGTADEWASQMEDLSPTDDVFNAAPAAGATPTRGIGASIDEVTNMDFATFSRAGENFSGVSDEIAAGSDEATEVIRNAVDTAPSGPLRNAGENVASTTRNAVDNATSTVRNVADSLSPAAAGRVFQQTRRALGLGMTSKVVLGALGTGVALKAGGYLNEKVPDSEGEYHTETKEYPEGGLKVAVYRGETLLGWAIMLGENPETGTMMVLGEDATPTQKVGIEGHTKIPRPRFDTEENADTAFTTFKDNLGSGGENDMTTDRYPRSQVWSGSVSAPSEAAQGASFDVEAEITNTASKPKSSRMVLAVMTSPQPVMLGEVSVSADAGTQTRHTISVPSGALSVEPGEYDLMVVATESGQGLVASKKLSVNPGEGSSQWTDPQIVQEYGNGWYLVGQTEVGGERARFFVVGKRESDGEYIYIHQDGRARTEPFPFPTPGKAGAALKEWQKRNENGNVGPTETPSESASRPDMARVHRDSAALDSRASQGSLNRLTSMATSSPLLTLAGFVIVGLAAYYAYQQGMIPSLGGN